MKGAAAIVMNSLFEEQIITEQLATHDAIAKHGHAFAEATSFVAQPSGLRLGPDLYLEQIRKIKSSVDMPVIASLNGTTLEVVVLWKTHGRGGSRRP
ncbi:MAG: hypothetical protein R3C68_18365 [Myxococcota bacterium]